ncbi:nonribosomal peptide synthetase 1 [Bipolaris maydis]|nr:nonribosomal peptide synthetase 1 [Bipolaris maydis]
MGDCQEELSNLSAQDLEKIWAINEKILPAAVDRCVHELFAEQAKARPTAPALCAWDGEMTYDELDRLSSQLANHLIHNLEVKPEDIVPLCFEKSMWTIVAILAVLKAGGAFVPLDPDHPASRHEEIFKQTEAKLVLTSVQHAMLWPDPARHVVPIGEAFVSQLSSTENMKEATVNPSNTAYIMFTSGSTGIPKGVVLEHRAVSTSCLSHGKAIGLKPDTRALQFATYTFDACIAEIITPLLHGSCICIPSEDDRQNALPEAINTMNVNWAQLTPTVARLLDPQKTPSLRTLVLGGERVNAVDWERWGDSVEQINAYGPTECAVWCTSYTNGAQGYKPGIIGKPIASVSWVVDPDDCNKLVPLGAIGELLVEGPIQARGYLNDVVKTEAAFINNPSWLLNGTKTSAGRQGRLYKTGDLVYYNTDGNLMYIGRKDSQVKVRGQRVELSEIEYHLHECMPEVKQMAVEVISPAGDTDKAMVAVFLELDEETCGTYHVSESFGSNPAMRLARMDDTDIELVQRLPSHMVPEVYFAIAKLPMTTSTKVNRRQLREIGASLSIQQLAEMRTSSRGISRRPAETQVERTMQQLWAQVLGIEASRIGLDDSFFRLGGDSISAMRLVAEARHLGLNLTVYDIFHAPRLGHLANQTMHHLSTGLSAITRGEYSGPVAQSFAQNRLWFLEALHPGLHWYLVPIALRINGPLQLDALKAALRTIEHRHETLRTTFSTHNGTGVQLVHQFSDEKDVTVIEVPSNDKHHLLDALQEDQTTSFCLQNEPGWRVRIYRLNEQEHVLSIVMHHIVSDGWSLDVLKKELAVLYAAAVRGENLISRLSPLPVQYRDFSAWQRMPEQMQGYQKQLEYWVAELQSSRPAEFLCDKPRPMTLSGKAGVHKIRIDGQVCSKLRRFCRTHEVTPFVVLLATFRAAHYRLTGQEDATIGTPNANRDQWELKDMIGFFVNMQCIRIKVEDDETFKELVQQVYNTVVASLANQDVPFESVVSTLQRDRDISRNPLAQVAFALHTQKDLGKLTLEGVDTNIIDVATTSRFDLEFHFFQERSGLQGYIYFSEDLFVPETIACLGSVFETLLDQCLARPETKIASTQLMTNKTYAQLDQMKLLQVDDKPGTRASNIVDVFREQAAAWSSKVAIKDTRGEMTYDQLDIQSDRLAQALTTRALTPETAIGVLALRSCETIVAFLGILKAGLAYVPLDAKSPAERTESILSSFQGQRLVLVGMDVEIPVLTSENVEFVRIADMLNGATDNSLVRGTLEGNHSLGPSANSIAYIIFTSGSTGRPKGVMVEHRGIVRMAQHDRITDFQSTKATAHMANLAFDGSSWEIYTCLLNGGTLVCIDANTVLDQDALLEVFTRHSIRIAFFTPALLKLSLAASPRTIGALDVLLVAGDRADPGDMLAAQSLVKGKVANAYGPTENSVMSTLYILTENEKFVNGVPIGRAISSSGAYVMDSKQQLVPLGVIGELVVTGDGLARGYTDSRQDIDRFIVVTISGTTIRAYRTGDYVRQRPMDGQLEFFGRMDGQVKIRGHRIELGEIESVLCSHRCVRDAAVVLAQKDQSDHAIFGYVTLKQEATMTEDPIEDSRQLQHVNAWEERFDSETYALIDGIKPETVGRDFVGWTSMYDGSDIDKAEMNEWLDETIRAIFAITNGEPRHILEIGSGTGMILFNLRDSLQGYVGLDPSEKAVSFIMETARCIPSFKNKVRMYQATATDTNRIERPLTADLAILNSVVQYFPSQEYLFRVVEDLLHIEGIKMLFFGDIRSHALHREFLAMRALQIAGDGAGKEDILRIMEDMEQVERELLVDPGFFTSLPSRLPGLVEQVEIQPKKMKATNELSCYRYTAIVHTKYGRALCKEVRRVAESEWIDFETQKLNRSSLLQRLENLSSAHTVAVSNIPHSKTIFSRCLLSSLDSQTPVQREWISSVRQQADQTPCLSATDLMDIAEEAGCRVEISWSRQYSQRGGLDCIFYSCQPDDKPSRALFEFPSDHADRPQHTFSNRPLHRRFVKEVRYQLEETVRLQLPEYMVPKSIHVLEKLPINASGKVDRKALTQKAQLKTRGTQGTKRQPRTQAERTMQQLWAQVLGIETSRIGLDDSFFRLGGDSITAMKLVAVAREKQVGTTVANIFQYPKLAEMAARANQCAPILGSDIAPFSLLDPSVDPEQVCKEVAAVCNIDPNLIEDVYPCSPLQEGMLSLTLKHAGDYTMQCVLELRADANEDAFRAAWEEVTQSLLVLRTRILQHSTLGLLQAVLAEKPEWVVANNLATYLDQSQSSPIELGQPLVHFALVRDQQTKKRWFVWTIHHALYDGWSVPRIVSAVRTIYDGGVLRKQPGFNSFIKYLSKQDQDATATYWKAALGGCTATTPFPPLVPGVQPPIADAIVEYQCPSFPRMTSDATLSATIRAAWAILISQYTGLDDVVFGATVNGRNAPVAGIEDIIGPTIATVPVRIRIDSKEWSVQRFLGLVQKQATDMIPYEQTGLQQIAKLGLDAQHACGFQTLLVVQPTGDELEVNNEFGIWESVSGLQGFTTYALMVQCTPTEKGLRFTASFDARVINHWRMEKMLHQLSFVIQQLTAADAGTKVAEIDTTTPEDREQLWTWNQTVPAATSRCVHELFAEQAKARPSALAICAWDGEMTYSELARQSTQLAGYLVNLGVGVEDIVPLCFEKSIWTVVAMLAVLKAGGAFVALDPDHPTSRHKMILKQTFKQRDAKVVLTSVQHATMWKDLDLAGNVVAVSEALISRLPSSEIDGSRVQPHNTAYIIFTSGSTGVPKGIILEHKALSTSCLGHGRAFGMSHNTRVLQFSTYTFDASMAEIVTTLVHGGCLCVPSESERRDGLAEAMNKMDVNWAMLTSSVARLLDPKSIPSLKTLVLVGEQVTPADWNRWPHSVQMINGYGPSECCIICTCHAKKEDYNSGTIGKSVASTSWIVHPENHNMLVPLGCVGELLVEGPILARGYLEDEEMTNSVFVHDPIWLLEGCKNYPGRPGKLYKTGDLVHYNNSDGTLTYIGRKDNQVKIRGQRIELGEIEHCLYECIPGVKQLAVEAIQPSGQGSQPLLAAFLHLQSNTQHAELIGNTTRNDSTAQFVLPDGVDKRLTERLPEYMVPTVFFSVAQMPMTASRKTDRRRLREIGASFSAQQLVEMRTRSKGPKRQPTTQAELTMQHLWAKVLGIEAGSIGLDDSFFRLGGDSITAMKLVGEAKKQSILLNVADLLRNPKLSSVVHLAHPEQQPALVNPSPFSLLSSTRQDHLLSELLKSDESLCSTEVSDILPATHMQHVVISRGIRSRPLAFNYLFLDMGYEVDIPRLKDACSTLVQHFSMLRTKFVYLEGNLWQVVLRSPGLRFSEFELSKPLEKASDVICTHDIAQSSPTELPTSFMFIKSADGEHRLIIRLSHAQYDGVCLPKILDTLSCIYNRKPLGPSYPFSTFLAYAQSQRPASELYWRRLLQGSNMIKITSLLCPRVPESNDQSGINVVRIINMPKLPKNLTTASVVSAAWAMILSHITGEEDVTYASIVAGRNSNVPYISEIVGPCVNVIPVRAQVLPSKTLTELACSIQDQYTSLGESDSMGFKDIAQSCTDWPAGTMFDSVIQHQNIDENPTIDFPVSSSSSSES